MSVAPIVADVRSEARKVVSTKLWWGLLVPVVLLAILINSIGGSFTAGTPAPVRMPLLLGSLAYTLGLASTFAAVHGVVAAAGEHRHRTITTTYLTGRGRGAVLGAKMLVSGGVGACYGMVAAVVGVLSGLLVDAGAADPARGALLPVTLIGVVVSALWGAIGAAFGTAVSNQVGALVALLLYLTVGETLAGVLLGAADSATVDALSAYLPGNAGEVAVYDIPARELAEPRSGLVEGLAGVTAPPSWPVSLLVLAGWTAVVGAVGWWVGGRRDIT